MNESGSNNSSSRSALITAALLGVLLLIIALQVAFYPQLASWAHETVTRQGWDGSGLRYVQFFYVLPAAIGLVVLIVGMAFAVSGRPNLQPGLMVLAWLTDLAAFAISVAWYANATGSKG